VGRRRIPSAARGATAALLLAGLALAGCRDRPATDTDHSANTAVLGAPAPAHRSASAAPEPEPMKDADGHVVPLPPLPADATAQAAMTGPYSAWAIWVQDGRVVGSRYTREGG
jgi:hypothetical protein